MVSGIPPAPPLPNATPHQESSSGCCPLLRLFRRRTPPAPPPSINRERIRFAAEIADGAERMRLQRVVRWIGCGEPPQTEPFVRFSDQYNYIAQFSEPRYLPVEAFHKLLTLPSLKDFEQLVDRAANAVPETEKKCAHKIREVKHRLLRHVKKYGEFTPRYLWDYLTKHAEGEGFAPLRKELQACDRHMRFIERFGKFPPTLKDVPILVERDALLSSLRTLDPCPAKLIHWVRRQSTYFPLAVIRKKVHSKRLRKLLKTQQQIVSSYDLFRYNHLNAYQHQCFRGVLKDTLGEVDEFAFKMDGEAARELLAYRVLSAIGLEKYVVRKRWLLLPNFRKDGGEARGVAGRWVKGEHLGTAWQTYRWMRGSQAIQWQLGRYTDISSTEKALLDLGGRKSIQYHIVADLLLEAYDSHARQYLQEEGEWYQLDYARSLSPSVVLQDHGQLKAMLHSLFFDHPAVDEPLNEELRQMILSWDLRTVQRQLTKEELGAGQVGIVQSRAEEIERRWQFLEQWKRNLWRRDATTEEYRRLREAEKELMKWKREVEGELMSHLHPYALMRLMKRLHKTQKLVRDNPQLTGRELFAGLYPHLVSFVTVADRVDGKGGEDLSEFTLQEIIEIGEEHGKATPGEVKRMKKDLKALKREVLSAEYANWTVGFSDHKKQ